MRQKAVREPIATWWKIALYDVQITPVKVVAFSAEFVTIRYNSTWSGPPQWFERRERRVNCFPTFAEAKVEATRRAEREVEAAKRNLQNRRSALRQWESLKEPDGAAQ